MEHIKAEAKQWELASAVSPGWDIGWDAVLV
jgi:hypothetical protein